MKVATLVVVLIALVGCYNQRQKDIIDEVRHKVNANCPLEERMEYTACDDYLTIKSTMECFHIIKHCIGGTDD